MFRHKVPVEDDIKSESSDFLCFLKLLSDAESDLHERNRGFSQYIHSANVEVTFSFYLEGNLSP